MLEIYRVYNSNKKSKQNVKKLGYSNDHIEKYLYKKGLLK